MELWRKVWRGGVAPLLADRSLTGWRAMLDADDPRWQQGVTTTPPPLACVADWDCQGACGIGCCGMALGLVLVGEVNEFFARTCYEIDQRMGEPAACRWWLNFHDETPRQEVRREMIAEIERELARRAGQEAA